MHHFSYVWLTLGFYSWSFAALLMCALCLNIWYFKFFFYNLNEYWLSEIESCTLTFTPSYHCYIFNKFLCQTSSMDLNWMIINCFTFSMAFMLLKSNYHQRNLPKLPSALSQSAWSAFKVQWYSCGHHFFNVIGIVCTNMLLMLV